MCCRSEHICLIFKSFATPSLEWPQCNRSMLAHGCMERITVCWHWDLAGTHKYVIYIFDVVLSWEYCCKRTCSSCSCWKLLLRRKKAKKLSLGHALIKYFFEEKQLELDDSTPPSYSKTWEQSYYLLEIIYKAANQQKASFKHHAWVHASYLLFVNDCSLSWLLISHTLIPLQLKTFESSRSSFIWTTTNHCHYACLLVCPSTRREPSDYISQPKGP